MQIFRSRGVVLRIFYEKFFRVLSLVLLAVIDEGD